MKKLLFAIPVMLLLTSCARFKVSKLSPSELFNIPIGGSPANLSYPEQKGLYYEIPGRVAVVDNLLVISEPSNRQIKIYRENKLETVITSSEKSRQADIKKEGKIDYRQIVAKGLNIPGAVTAGNDDDFFVINYISASDESLPDSQGTSGYYKILHFDTKGTLLQIIGRKAQMDLPFESILWMDTDEDNNLWVLYKYIDSLTLDRYKDGQLVVSIDQKRCEQSLFAEPGSDKNLINQCEEMYPFYDGESILLIGRQDRLPEKKADAEQVYSFEKRVYKTLTLKNGKTESIFDNMNDPEDYPYIPYESNLLIWKTVRSDRFKIAVYDTDGDLIKFLQIDLPDRRNNWRSTYATLSGRFYSIRIQGKSLHVYEWK